MKDIALQPNEYTWKNALLWGNFVGHCKKATQGSLGHRLVHALIALAELLPGVSQITSIAEKIFVTKLVKKIQNHKPLDQRKIEPIEKPLAAVTQLGQQIISSTPSAPVEVPHSTEQPALDISAITSLKPITKHLISPDTQASFSSIHSNTLSDLNGIQKRSDFQQRVAQGQWNLKPVVISKSEFVSASMAEHLMRNKKDTAIAIKYEVGDKITNMEGALHSFMTPICPTTMTADYAFKGSHSYEYLNGKGRTLVLSAAIHPDFERASPSEVVMRIVEAKANAIEGKMLPIDTQPLWEQVKGDRAEFESRLPDYEKQLKEHMIYNLTSDHKLPSLSTIESSKIADFKLAEQKLNGLIVDSNADPSVELHNQFVKINGHVISLEALYNIYLHQIRNEFSVLESLLPQGYVYTIDPPSIFAKQLGGDANVSILNRLQILALKQIHKNTPLNNLKMIGFNDYNDSAAVRLLQKVFPNKVIESKKELFKGGKYSVENDYALVEHNNSDAFGQNIETEGPTSKDGVLGYLSDASCHLNRTRADLLQLIV
jgi:hypothetical protein